MKTLIAIAFSAFSYSAVAQVSFPSFDSIEQHKIQMQPTDIYMTSTRLAEVQAQNWVGIFYDKKEQPYIAPTEIKGIVSKDDKDWYRTNPRSKDKCLLLFSNWDTQKRNLAAIEITEPFSTGTSHSFSYNQIDYRLYSTGEVNGDVANNYKLFLEVRETGKSDKCQLLITHPQMYYNTVSPLLISDLDGDGKLDFIINASEEEMTYAPILYLSTFAKGGDLLGIAAQYIQFMGGC